MSKRYSGPRRAPGSNVGLGLLALALVHGCGGGKDDEGDGTATGTGTGTGDSGTIDGTGAAGPVDAGDSVDDALLLDADLELEESKKVAAGVIDPAGDRDFFALSGSKGDFFSFWTEAYRNGNSSTDTVIRVYDSDGNLIAENDDMAFRHQETDSASFFQLQQDGSFYVEILEFSDWKETDDIGAKGGSGYKYDLWVKQLAAVDQEPNDTTEDADALWEAIEGTGYIDSIVYTLPEYASFFVVDFVGTLEPGDVDIWPIKVNEDFLDLDQNILQWSFWPGVSNDMQPMFTLLDSDFTELAITDSPEVTPSFPWLYDAGITYRAQEGEMYYLKVENKNPESLTTKYAGEIALGYLPENSVDEAESNDTEGTAMPIEGSLEASEDGTTDFTRINGYMDPGDVEWLSLASTNDVEFEGRFLQARVHAIGAGSHVDPKLTIIIDDATAAESTEFNGTADAGVEGYELTSDSTIYFKIEAETQGPEEAGNAWFFFASIRDEKPDYEY